MKEVNSMFFEKENLESMYTLLKVLNEQSYDKGGFYNDVRIYPEDMGAFIVEWVQLPWDHSYGGNFEYVEEDNVICVEKKDCDGTYYYVPRDEIEIEDEI